MGWKWGPPGHLLSGSPLRHVGGLEGWQQQQQNTRTLESLALPSPRTPRAALVGSEGLGETCKHAQMSGDKGLLSRAAVRWGQAC